MNVRNVLIVPLVLAVLTTPALAKKHNHTDGLNQTGDPCELLTCMAGKLQGDTQPACQTVNQRFFNVRVLPPTIILKPQQGLGKVS